MFALLLLVAVGGIAYYNSRQVKNKPEMVTVEINHPKLGKMYRKIKKSKIENHDKNKNGRIIVVPLKNDLMIIDD
jgi:hypothetical protein